MRVVEIFDLCVGEGVLRHHVRVCMYVWVGVGGWVSVYVGGWMDCLWCGVVDRFGLISSLLHCCIV